MGPLVRRCAKALLFTGLFLVSVRFVHTYPIPMPVSQQHVLFELSEKFGVADPEMFYIYVAVLTNLGLAALEYRLLIWMWCHCRTKYRDVRRRN